MMGRMAPLRHQRAKLVFRRIHEEREPSMSELRAVMLREKEYQPRAMAA
jgi:hypothetical protein